MTVPREHVTWIFFEKNTTMLVVATRYDGVATMRAMLDAKVDHVAIAVRDLQAAIRLYVGALGARFLFSGEREDQGFLWAQFGFPGGGKVELVTPTDPKGFVARFLDKRGEGVHHVTLKVPDIMVAIDRLNAQSVPLFNVSTHDPSWKEAFIHPRDANGALIQVAQSVLDDEELARHHLDPHPDGHHRHYSLDELLQPVTESSREADGT